MQSCPAEVLDAIVHQIPVSYPGIDRDYDGVHDLAVCATTCRALSMLAQPLLFKHILISNEHRGRTLLDLTQDNDQLAQWIEKIHFNPKDVRDYELCEPGLTIARPNGLSLWLGSDEGLILMSQISHVETVEVSDLRHSRHGDVGDVILADAWRALLSLRCIRDLKLCRCDISSFDLALELFDNPTSISLSNVQVLTPPSHAHPNAVLLPKVHGLSITHSPSRGTEDETVRALVDRLRCTALTSLDLSSCDDGSDPIYLSQSFSCAQGILNAAPCLEKLVLRHMGNYGDAGSVSLRHNTNVRHLAFYGINSPSLCRLYESALESLPEPGQLRSIELSGLWSQFSTSNWHTLDLILSVSPYRSAPRKRRLVIVERSAEDFIFPFDAIPSIKTLGWFDVKVILPDGQAYSPTPGIHV